MVHPAIDVQSLEKTYRDGLFHRRSVQALRGVSFSVQPGVIFGLLGPNGAGKTTLIKILLGLVRKTGGKASVLGMPAGNRSSRRRVGYLPENHRMPGHLTGNSALEFYGGLSGLGPGEVRRRIGPLLSRVGLDGWGDVSVRKYSKGMLQRLGLAQAMLHDPQLLVLDEPSDGVDPVGRSEMRTLLRELRSEGKTIFINSHLLQEVEQVCDRAAILVQGTLRREGSIDEIRACRRLDVQFTVAATEQIVRQCLGETEMVCHGEGEGMVRFVKRTTDQSTVNRLIDQLRASRLDIIAITRLRPSLEDAFLEIVSRGKDELERPDDPPERRLP